ncbi:aspartate kinase [Clostridium ljungdahlii]|uniref:Aspartokinase n=1 Tax=Clostridium ljungdahlii (strain ATCC 55383 / DSM 13528 / PETC) TaxID=748727 RepID=D8GUI0_CLOLD|nr:aspartate kinase [Clostridium ljungdahlii]ADK16857.1 aspartokinase [Clostridium ljungdahlii DSM 13528]OAA85598.1 Aspartokinase [Clostridium ljungdahlii DSM 13528]
MAIIVQKYGGSSVGTPEKIKNVAKTVVSRVENGDSLVVVVSAMGDTTDDLIALSKKITDTPDKRELDALLSTGEMMSCALLAMAIKDLGYDAVSYTAYQIGIKTSGQYGKSLICDINGKKIKKSLDEGKVVIAAGFQGINDKGDITTLGRGGSDTSAVAIAVKLKGSCEIYTDVDGIYSVDPRKYKDAKKLDEIDYEEMLELSSLGAQVMHSRSIELAQKYNIPVYVGLSNSDIRGTVIKGVDSMNLESKPVTGLATSDEDAAITLTNIDNDINIISNLFEKIAEKRVNVDMISQTAPVSGKVNISFTVPKIDLKDCLTILKSYFNEKTKVDIDENITKFSVVGIGMKTTSGVVAKMLKLFKENNIGVKMITTSEIRITCAIKQEDKMKTINLVAKEFNL